MSSSTKKPYLGTIIAIIVGIVMLTGAVYLVTSPLRSTWSKQFLSRGDQFLNQKKYVSAIVEYKKAQLLSPSNTTSEKLKTAQDSQTNIAVLENYYREENNIVQLELYNQVRDVPNSSYDMVELSKNLIEKNEPQLAVLAATTATEMDSSYRDAWLYLGLSNLAVAKNVELSGNNASLYINNGKQALEKAQKLDPSYAVTNDLIKQIQ